MSPFAFRIGFAAGLAVLAAAATADRRPAPPVEPATDPVWADFSDPDWTRRMEARAVATVERIEQKSQVVAELRAGRIDRPTAVARFRQMLTADPGLLAEYRTRQPGLTDDQLAADNLDRHCSAAADR